MNVIQAVQDYITKMITNIQGMKVLLVDKETVGIVSIVYSRTQILQREAYHFERIDSKNREVMAHLKCVAFLRPTEENRNLLEEELKNPKYGEYHIFFSNTTRNSYIEDLAQSDTHEVVQQVQEFFADYYAVNKHVLTLNIDGLLTTQHPEYRALGARTTDGIASILLSLKKQPVIRYSGRSSFAKRIAEELDKKIREDAGLYDFKKLDTPPVLLILDRADDPITPLLTEWTYQAMVHEEFSIRNNVVSLAKVKGIRADLKEIVLSSQQDEFFDKTMYMNFGDLGVKIKELVDSFQEKSKGSQQIVSIQDIKNFVENFPEFKKMSGNVSKHVTLMSELSGLVDKRALLQLSEVEQQLANNQDHSDHVERIKGLFADPKVSNDDLLRVVMLYAIRYEGSSNQVSSFSQQLEQRGLERDKLGRIALLLQYAGSSARTGDLLKNKNLIATKIISLKRGIKGVENIYTEHKPLLKSTLDTLLANRLRDVDYPFIVGAPSRDVPQDIIVFMVGGITFEEALTVHQFNTSGTGVRIVLGGTTIHNSKSFLEDVGKLDMNRY